MATIVDELIVRLGLDASGFEAGQKKATQSFQKTKESALATGKNIEDGAKKVANSIERMTRNVLALFGAIAGARSLQDLVSNLTQVNAELGRFSANVNLGPQTMSAWVAAAERLGGTGAQVKQTFSTLSQTFTNFRNGLGQMPEEFWRLRQASGVAIDPLANTETQILQISEAIKKLAETDRQTAFNYATALGIDPGTFEVMRKYGAGVNDYIKSLEKSVAPSNEAIKVAQKLQESWAKLVQQIEKLITVLYEKLGPTIDDILKKMGDWLDKNQKWIETGIVDAVERLRKAFEGIEWQDITDGLKSATDMAKSFAAAAQEIVGSIDNIVNAAKPLMKLIELWQKAQFGILDAPANFNKLFGGDASAAAKSKIESDAANANKDGLKNLMQEMQKGLEDGGNGDNGMRAMGGTTVDGRPVSRGNPMPVVLAQGNAEGGGFWSWLGGLFSGNNNGTAPGSPGPAADQPTSLVDKATNWLKSVMPGGDKTDTEGGNSPENGWWTAERQKHAYKRLREEAGLSHEGAKGLISRWAHVEAVQGPGAVNPNSGAFGIAQWLGDRKKDINGNTNYDDQLAHAIKELNSTEKLAGDRLRNAKTAEEAAIAASTFERAEGWNGQSDNFVNKTLAGMKGMDDMLSGKLASNLSYTNQNATRNQKLKPELETMLSDAIRNVYGDGYRGEIYSGGQDEIGKGPRRRGSTRHDNGGAGDVYIVGPDGKRLKGDQLAPLAQYWLANKNGGVGLEMENGGIHLDQYKNRTKNWWYRQHTKKQADAVNAGLMGTMPELMGADLATKTNAIANNDNRRNTTSSVDTRIGNVHIHTQATDGKSIADDIWDGLHKRVGQSSQAAANNFGPQ